MISYNSFQRMGFGVSGRLCIFTARCIQHDVILVQFTEPSSNHGPLWPEVIV